MANPKHVKEMITVLERQGRPLGGKGNLVVFEGHVGPGWTAMGQEGRADRSSVHHAGASSAVTAVSPRG